MAARSQPRVPRWLPSATYVFVSVATVILLLLHTLEVGGTRVDTTTLGLLVLLLLVPLAPYIRRLSAGGVEAEIGREEVQGLRAAAADLPPAPDEPTDGAREAPTVQELIVRDPQLALAKLRIEIERELRELYGKRIPSPARQGLSLGMMARELAANEVLPREVNAPLADFAALANRSIHGEYVPSDVAEDIANVGLRVLAALSSLNQDDGPGRYSVT